MAHILFLSPYYPPENAAAAVCVSETAKRLATRGHQVTVLTTVPNYPTGKVAPEYRGHLLQRQVIDGVQVIRVWSYTSPNRHFFRRILGQLSFGLLAPLLGSRSIGRPDLIIAQSPPLFDAIAVRTLARLKRCPFIFMVSDLWPESAVQFGMLHNQFLIRLSEWLEWSTYQRASLVWVVTEGLRDLLLQRGLPAERILVLTNGVDTVHFSPLSRQEARQRLGWDDRFTVLYAGNHGLQYSLTTILDVAEQLQSRTDLRFVLVGDGSRKVDILAQAQKRQLTNITFHEPVAHQQMPWLLAAADICLVPLRKIALLESTVPLKMLEIMACARPFILGAEGISCKLAGEEARAALCVEPENASALASAILYLHAHPDVAETMGQNGRAFVEERFNYDRLTEALDTTILQFLLPKKSPLIPAFPSEGAVIQN